MQDIQMALTETKASLEGLSQRIVRYRIPPPILEGFKLALDQLRLTIWAVIMADEEDSKRADGLHVGLATKLAEFRIKRLMKMLAELQREIDRGSTPPTPSELCKLNCPQGDAQDRVRVLYQGSLTGRVPGGMHNPRHRGSGISFDIGAKAGGATRGDRQPAVPWPP